MVGHQAARSIAASSRQRPDARPRPAERSCTTPGRHGDRPPAPAAVPAATYVPRALRADQQRHGEHHDAGRQTRAGCPQSPTPRTSRTALPTAGKLEQHQVQLFVDALDPMNDLRLPGSSGFPHPSRRPPSPVFWTTIESSTAAPSPWLRDVEPNRIGQVSSERESLRRWGRGSPGRSSRAERQRSARMASGRSPIMWGIDEPLHGLGVVQQLLGVRQSRPVQGGAPR